MVSYAGEEPLGVGLVGYGYWGPNLARNLAASEFGDFKACCELDEERLGKASSNHPGIVATGDLEEFLSLDGLDAVAVATPIASHYSVARQALEAGKHVFVEKPLAATTVEAKSLVEEASRRNLVLMVGHTFLYSPPVRKVKELIRSGELGDIYYISSSRVNLGIHQSDASVLWDLAPHDFSILFDWLDAQPCRISATGKDYILDGNHDVIFVDLEFPSGAIAHVEASWLSPAKKRLTTIVGSKQMAIYDDIDTEGQVKIYDKGVMFVKHPANFGEHQLTYRTGDINTPRLDAYEPLSKVVDEFLGCAREGRTPLSDGLNGLRVVEALEAAEESIQLGGFPVDLPAGSKDVSRNLRKAGAPSGNFRGRAA